MSRYCEQLVVFVTLPPSKNYEWLSEFKPLKHNENDKQSGKEEFGDETDCLQLKHNISVKQSQTET